MTSLINDIAGDAVQSPGWSCGSSRRSYCIVFWTTTAQTPGKMVLGISVRRADAPGPLDVVTAIRRRLLSAIRLVPFVSGIYFILFLLDGLWPLLGRQAPGPARQGREHAGRRGQAAAQAGADRSPGTEPGRPRRQRYRQLKSVAPPSVVGATMEAARAAPRPRRRTVSLRPNRSHRVHAPAATARPTTPTRSTAPVLKIAGVVVLGAIMSILDITVVNVALPTFQTVFDARHPIAYSTVAWTVTAYTLALATVIPLTGWAADRFGTKRLYMTRPRAVHRRLGAVRHRLVASSSLIGFRVLQGLGGGMLMPLGMTIMTRAAGPAPDRPADGDPRRPDAARPDLRPDPRRLADRGRQLALDLPDQRADRHRRAASTPCGCCPRTRPSRRSRSTSSACCCCRRAWRCSCSASPRSPARGTVIVHEGAGPDAASALVLIVTFVFYSLPARAPAARPAAVPQPQPHASRSITMFLFAAAFFGGLLLVPTYFQQVRG